jgi:hypothetical protein
MGDYKKDLTITLEDLGDNWLDQPQKFMEYGESWANAVRTRDKKKEMLDITKAELDSDIRANWENYGFDKKPTEAAISAAITQDKKFKDANEELAQAIEDMNIMAVAKSAFEHRKKALENITSLYLAGYYGSKPKLQDTNGVVDRENPHGDPQNRTAHKSLQKRKRTLRRRK